MGFAIFTFLVIFLLFVSGGLLLFYREAMLQRIHAVVKPREEQENISGVMQYTGRALGGVVERFESVLPKSQSEVSIAQRRLIRAGFRGDSAIKKFYGAKVLIPVILCVLVTVTGIAQASPFIAYLVALAAGFLAPDFWLSRKIAARQAAIRRGLPDVLDLLVICIEAGQSLDQATARTSRELRLAQPAITDELHVVVLEQRAGRPRTDAWRNFAERSGVDAVRNLASVLIQSEQFGTSAAKTLRIHSDTLRTQRRQKVEEQAAKTSVKLVFPLVFFIFPSLFLVTLGPAVIVISDSFKQFTNR
ncbi:MAG TPA: type II secretion system F family protein [Acidobacteriaceae bacterium]|jgi:tight adherence protein C|nr:type II secretion system F family protein [Acidobacteriaceae bacterium]